jgi:HEAT repeat protein
MPLIDKPYGWVWYVFAAWLAARLLLALVLAIHQAVTLGQRHPTKLMIWLNFVSAAAWAMLASLGWRPFVGDARLVFSCLSIGLGIAGFVFGMAFDMFLTFRVQTPIAVGFVARKASTYADRLVSGEPEQRLQAARALAFIGPKASFAVSLLLDALKDSDADLRFESIRAFGNIESDDAAIDPAMFKALADSDPRVRVVAAAVLVRRKKAEPDQVLPHLSAGLAMEEPNEMMGWSTGALADLGPRAGPAVPNLVAMFGADTNRNFYPRYVLAKVGAAAVPALVEKLGTDNEKVRSAVLETLMEIGPPASDALPDLRKLLTHEDKSIRELAARVIGKIESD